ncbi:phosphoribosylglycinamide formyltransferase 2 [Pseudomonas sp. PvP001]
MTRIGTPLSPTATRVLLCGCGELGKEVVIELQRLGVEVIAVDRYADAPAMQVAHRSHVINMLDGAALRSVIEAEKPHYIVPEIEAIATATLVELESEGFTVVPTARAAQLTMNREGIRRLAAEELDLPTSPYHFADTFEDYERAVQDLGFPCVVKPVMSSSGKGQSLLRTSADVQAAWEYAQEGGRAGKGRVIIEGFIDFDYEITLLTVRHVGGTTFCAPVGHRQEKGDYQESWQPQAMSPVALAESERVARAVTEALGGRGLFGVELFIKGDQVWFSEVSPRPHDTGLVTLISQGPFPVRPACPCHSRPADPAGSSVRAVGLGGDSGRGQFSPDRLRQPRCGTGRTGYGAASVRQAGGQWATAHGRGPGPRRIDRSGPGEGHTCLAGGQGRAVRGRLAGACRREAPVKQECSARVTPQASCLRARSAPATRGFPRFRESPSGSDRSSGTRRWPGCFPAPRSPDR